MARDALEVPVSGQEGDVMANTELGQKDLPSAKRKRARLAFASVTNWFHAPVCSALRYRDSEPSSSNVRNKTGVLTPKMYRTFRSMLRQYVFMNALRLDGVPELGSNQVVGKAFPSRHRPSNTKSPETSVAYARSWSD
ncbi:MAG: hypothetical protein ACKVPX_16565 [Myxococcaceae bacterium]